MIMPQTRETSSFAIASLLVGLSCFVQFLGTEKAVLAFLFAILALRDIRHNKKKGKSLAYLAMALAVVFVLVVFLFLKAVTVE